MLSRYRYLGVEGASWCCPAGGDRIQQLALEAHADPPEYYRVSTQRSLCFPSRCRTAEATLIVTGATPSRSLPSPCEPLALAPQTTALTDVTTEPRSSPHSSASSSLPPSPSPPTPKSLPRPTPSLSSSPLSSPSLSSSPSFSLERPTAAPLRASTSLRSRPKDPSSRTAMARRGLCSRRSRSSSPSPPSHHARPSPTSSSPGSRPSSIVAPSWKPSLRTISPCLGRTIARRTSSMPSRTPKIARGQPG